MISLVENKQRLIADLCRGYGVQRLDLFGSAATDAFDSSRSDLDFLVEFLPHQQLGPWLRHYFAFQSELSRLFGSSRGSRNGRGGEESAFPARTRTHPNASLCSLIVKRISSPQWYRCLRLAPIHFRG